jgi:hypothetical protein
LAAVNSIAEPFGQAATQAPQPMQVAASKAASASDVAAGLDDPVERAAVHDQVLDDRESGGPPRLDVDHVAVGEVPHVQLAGGGGPLRAVRHPVDHHAAHAADTLAAVVVEGDRVVAVQDQLLVQNVKHLQEAGVGGDVLDVVRHHPALVVWAGLAPDAYLDVHHL